MRCKRLASKIGKFPIRSCSSGKEGKHYFIAYTSGYMQGQGWQAGRQAAGRPADRQKVEVRREVLEPLTIYTQEGKRRRKERKKYSRRGMLFTSPPSPLTPNFRGVWHLSSTQSFAAQPAKSLRRVAARSQRHLAASPAAPPALYYSTELRTSEFPHRPQSKKKTFTTSTSYSLLACSWKSPGVFLQGDKKKKVGGAWLCSIH